jgi:hypothetical protein
LDTSRWQATTNQIDEILEEIAFQIPPGDPSNSHESQFFRAAYFPTAPAILAPTRIYPNPGLPPEHWKYFPDSKLTIVEDGSNGVQVYWGAYYRSLGPSWLEAGAATGVLQPGAAGEFDTGAVFMSIYRKSETDLIGFYHAEDYSFGTNNHSFVSWKSIASCYSTNNGAQWIKRGQILSAPGIKPEVPTWGGVGDFCVVRDEAQSRWVCIFTGIVDQDIWMSVAISTDPEGKPGTWLKYRNGKFEEPGLGGNFDRLPGFEAFRGAVQNPAVHWNSFLKRYIMVMQTNGHIPEGSDVIDTSVYLSESTDLVHWTKPRILVQALPNERMWYPTVLDRTDLQAGQEAYLVYAYEYPWWATFGVKTFIYRQLQFW